MIIFSMKNFIQTNLMIILALLVTGCTVVQMGQESAEKVKTSNTHGYQNGVEPDEIRNFKDFLVDVNDVVIIAEDKHKTAFKLRNYELYGRLDMIQKPAEYCEDKGGKVSYGDQVAAYIYTEFDSIDFEFSSAKSNFKKKRKRGYNGWMKCKGTKDDFEILRKGRSKFFVVEHKKEQLQGYSLRWIIDYFELDDDEEKAKGLEAYNVGGWDYTTFTKLSSVCLLSEGRVEIFNRYTNKEFMEINAYFLQQLNPRNGKKAYLLAKGEFVCKGTKSGKDINYDISFAKKYRSLIYTKLQ